jgi:uncharacterized FlaG/YvyC family protein
MDVGIARPVGPAAQATVRTTDVTTAPTKTDLPPQAAVQQGSEFNALADRDPRDISAERRASAVAADQRRRLVDRDAATGLTVMKVIEERSGQVVDQIPAENYLRMKVALKSVLDGIQGPSSAERD